MFPVSKVMFHSLCFLPYISIGIPISLIVFLGLSLLQSLTITLLVSTIPHLFDLHFTSLLSSVSYAEYSL
jgi:hypothetical protein